MKSRFHDWGKVSCFLLYSIISAIYCHKLIGLNSEIKAKSYFLLLILSWERQFTTHFDQLSIFSKTLLRNDFKAVAAKEVGCSIELR